MKSKRDPRVKAYIDRSRPFARPILKHLRQLVHATCPKVEETLKWGMPSFLYNGKILCGLAGFKAHCALWFWKGSSFIKKKPGQTGAMGNFGRITSMNDLPSNTVLKGYLKIAMKLNEATAAKKKARRTT